MGRTNIDIDDDLVHRVMARYNLKTKREAVDLALRQTAGPKMTSDNWRDMRGAFPDFDVPSDEFTHDLG